MPNDLTGSQAAFERFGGWDAGIIRYQRDGVDVFALELDNGAACFVVELLDRAALVAAVDLLDDTKSPGEMERVIGCVGDLEVTLARDDETRGRCFIRFLSRGERTQGRLIFSLMPEEAARMARLLRGLLADWEE